MVFFDELLGHTALIFWSPRGISELCEALFLSKKVDFFPTGRGWKTGMYHKRREAWIDLFGTYVLSNQDRRPKTL